MQWLQTKERALGLGPGRLSGWAVGAGLAVAVALHGPVHGATVDSAYTTLAWRDGCAVIDQPGPDDPGAWAVLRCAGLGGRPVFVSDSDMRMSVWYGPGGGRDTAWSSFSAFNEVNDVIEWRGVVTADGLRPFAAIHRWFVDDGQGAGGRRQVLVISTVATAPGRDSCPVGYVDANANANANALARRVADQRARDFRCGQDTAGYHGATTNATPGPVVSPF